MARKSSDLQSYHLFLSTSLIWPSQSFSCWCLLCDFTLILNNPILCVAEGWWLTAGKVLPWDTYCRETQWPDLPGCTVVRLVKPRPFGHVGGNASCCPQVAVVLHCGKSLKGQGCSRSQSWSRKWHLCWRLLTSSPIFSWLVLICKV